MSAVTFMGADHHQMEAFLFGGSAETCTQFNAIQGCRAGSPSTLTITTSTTGWTAPRIKVSPTVLEREVKWFPFSHSQQLTSLPSVPIIHLPLRPLSKMLTGLTILHDIAAVSDTFSNHYSCWFLQHFCFMMLSKAWSPKPKAHAEADAVPGCNSSMKHIASGVDLPPVTGNALKVRVNSQYQPIRYFSSEIKLPIQGQKRDTRQTWGNLFLLVVNSKTHATLLWSSESHTARNQALTRGVEDSELQNQYPQVYCFSPKLL